MERDPSLDLTPGHLAVALFEPEIPGNAGNVARLCAATGSDLHLIGRLGFSLRHPDARRAAMDYWNRVETHRHIAWSDFRSSPSARRVIALSTRGEHSLWDTSFQPGDTLLLGPESRGLPDDLLEDVDLVVRIPMLPQERSLNLGTSAGIALYEALRQIRPTRPA